jgi:hypothetical protein
MKKPPERQLWGFPGILKNSANFSENRPNQKNRLKSGKLQHKGDFRGNGGISSSAFFPLRRLR